MKTTPRLAIPYAEPGDDMNAYPVDADLPQATRVETIWYPGTGWTNLTGIGSGTFRYRLIGSLVILDIGMAASFADNATVTISAAPIPAAIRPAEQSQGFAQFNGYPGFAYVDTGGNVKARQSGSGSTKSNVTGQILYGLV